MMILLKKVNDMSKSDQESMSRADRKKQNNNKSQKGGLWKKILLGILGVILAILVAGGGLFAYYAAGAPELTEEDLTGTYAAEFVDMNGEVFHTLGGVEREYATADEYPEVLTESVIAIEDQRFADHLGIDPIGIGRAAVGYVANQEIVGGGSTITQQLIKNSVFSTLEEDQTLERKAQEAWLAIQLEQELSKEQIMTLYLNRIHMGGNVYGMATAAEEYYGKHVSELELHEAAMFAGMPRAPNYYNPYVDEEAAKNRRDTVLQMMVDTEAITQSEADAAMEIPITEGLQAPPAEDENQLVSDGYVTAVLDEIEEKTDYDPYTSGLTIQTNYDPQAQQLLYDVVNSDEYVNYPDEELQTASTLVDSTTGQITAIIGGRNLEGQLSTNRATDLQRDIGSTIKPLTVYGPAVEFLEYSTYHQVDDEPYELNGWEPGNYDGDFEGQMSMRDALVDSRNVPTAKLFNEDLGGNHGEIGSFLESLGIDVSQLSAGAEGLVPANAISGAMSPVDLAGAYAAFANNGTYTEPYAVNSVITQDGEEIDLTPDSQTAMEDYTSYMINDILKEVISYYGEDLTIPGYTQAAKTGTSNYTEEQQNENNIPSDGVPDNWVVGYSPYYTMSVWVGYDQPLEEGNYLTFDDGSRSLARDVYREAMSRFVDGLEERDWQQPDSVVEHTVAAGSDPAQLAAPGSDNTVTELFVRGNEPTETAEPEEPEEPEEGDLQTPSGLSANYVAESDEVAISWDAYELDEDMEGTVEYALTINDQEQVVSGTEYTITEPPRETLDISLAVRVGSQTGPSSSVQIIVPDPNEGDETEDEPDEEESEPPEENPDEGNGEDPPPEDENEGPPPDESNGNNEGNGGNNGNGEGNNGNGGSNGNGENGNGGNNDNGGNNGDGGTGGNGSDNENPPPPENGQEPDNQQGSNNNEDTDANN